MSQKEILYDGSVHFSSTVMGGDNLKVEEARRLFTRAVVEADVPGRWAWVEFIQGGVKVHWLEPKK